MILNYCMLQTIINDNDLDSNGFLSFDEFLLTMAIQLAATSDDEHRYITRGGVYCSIRYVISGYTVPIVGYMTGGV